MQIAAETAIRQSLQSSNGDAFSKVSISTRESRFHGYTAIRRHGAVQVRDPNPINLTKTNLLRLRFDRRGAEAYRRTTFLNLSSLTAWQRRAGTPGSGGNRFCQNLLSGRPGREFSSSGLALRSE